MGLDWDQIRADYRARLQEEAAAGADPVELRSTPKPRPRRPRSPGANPGGAPAHNRQQIVELYRAGVSAPQIAEQIGCHRQTVYNNLKAAGVSMRDDRATLPGPAPRSHCLRGHSFDEENTRVDRNGNRHCRACEQARWQRRREQKRQDVVENAR